VLADTQRDFIKAFPWKGRLFKIFSLFQFVIGIDHPVADRKDFVPIPDIRFVRDGDHAKARLARAAALEREFLSVAQGISARELPVKAGISKGDLGTYYGYLSTAGLVKKDNEVSALLGKMK